MIIYITIILLYASFLIEFILWPVASEASTKQLLKKWKTNLITHNFIYILIFIFNLVFTISPLILSIYFLVLEKKYDTFQMAIPGMACACIGRLFSMKGAYILNQNKDKHLITRSLYQWSRNPISFGLYITFLGLVMSFPYHFLIVGWIIFIGTMNYKIGIEERFLKEKYGEAYLKYQKSTPKYLLI